MSEKLLRKFTIQLAGAASMLIDPAALAAIHSFTQGNPRLIDNLMTDALTLGSQQDKKVIDAEITALPWIIRDFTDEVFKVHFLGCDSCHGLISKAAPAAFQTRLRQSAVNPRRVCGKCRYSTIGEVFLPKSKCSLHLPQCAV